MDVAVFVAPLMTVPCVTGFRIDGRHLALTVALRVQYGYTFPSLEGQGAFNMNIGAAAAAAGVSAKMIRHYEAIGLLRPAARRDNAYRDYAASDVHELRFVRRARRLGFSIDEIGELLALWRDDERPSREVRSIAKNHLADLEGRIAEMQAMAETLRGLVHACHGDDRPHCPILNDLAAEPTAGERLS
jgi:MerR family gold-responsive transcriptional activator of gol and ges genes